MKRQVTDWNKIFVDYISEKRLVSRIDNKFLELNHMKTKN